MDQSNKPWDASNRDSSLTKKDSCAVTTVSSTKCYYPKSVGIPGLYKYKKIKKNICSDQNEACELSLKNLVLPDAKPLVQNDYLTTYAVYNDAYTASCKLFYTSDSIYTAHGADNSATVSANKYVGYISLLNSIAQDPIKLNQWKIDNAGTIATVKANLNAAAKTEAESSLDCYVLNSKVAQGCKPSSDKTNTFAGDGIIIPENSYQENLSSTTDTWALAYDRLMERVNNYAYSQLDCQYGNLEKTINCDVQVYSNISGTGPSYVIAGFSPEGTYISDNTLPNTLPIIDGYDMINSQFTPFYYLDTTTFTKQYYTVYSNLTVVPHSKIINTYAKSISGNNPVATKATNHFSLDIKLVMQYRSPYEYNVGTVIGEDGSISETTLIDTIYSIEGISYVYKTVNTKNWYSSNYTIIDVEMEGVGQMSVMSISRSLSASNNYAAVYEISIFDKYGDMLASDPEIISMDISSLPYNADGLNSLSSFIAIPASETITSSNIDAVVNAEKNAAIATVEASTKDVANSQLECLFANKLITVECNNNKSIQQTDAAGNITLNSAISINEDAIESNISFYEANYQAYLLAASQLSRCAYHNSLVQIFCDYGTNTDVPTAENPLVSLYQQVIADGYTGPEDSRIHVLGVDSIDSFTFTDNKPVYVFINSYISGGQYNCYKNESQNIVAPGNCYATGPSIPYYKVPIGYFNSYSTTDTSNVNVTKQAMQFAKSAVICQYGNLDLSELQCSTDTISKFGLVNCERVCAGGLEPGANCSPDRCAVTTASPAIAKNTYFATSPELANTTAAKIQLAARVCISCDIIGGGGTVGNTLTVSGTSNCTNCGTYCSII